MLINKTKNKGLIDWLDEYDLHIKEIDEQHKRLAELINDFYQAFQTNQDEKSLYWILDNLLSETILHFSKEEAIMELHGYPGYALHKEEHDILSKEVTNMFKGYIKGERNKSEKIGAFLKEWLINHIVKEDKNLGEFLTAKGVI